MQGLTDSPRQALNPQLVIDLIQNRESIQVQSGSDLLWSDLSYATDLTPYMSSGSGATVSRDNYATVHGTCDLYFDSDVPANFESQLVRPWQKLVDMNTGEEAQFYLGVYSMTSPDHDNSRLPSVLAATGYDQLYFLDTPIGDSIQFLSGTNPLDGVTTLLDMALTNPTTVVTTTTALLSSNQVYPFDESDGATTYLSAINDLLSLCGYRGLWCDWNGFFHLEPYLAPSSRVPEWFFDLTATLNIVAEQRTSSQDIWSVPNYWRFVMTGLEVPPVEGVSQYTFTDNNPARPSSFFNRGRLVKSVQFVDAADYASLVSLAGRTINADTSASETFNVTTSPFPLAWHFDQIQMLDPNLTSLAPTLSPERRVQAQSWSMSLDGADTAWVWETVG